MARKTLARTRSGKWGAGRASDITVQDAPPRVAGLPAGFRENHAGQHHWNYRACIKGDGGGDGRSSARRDERARGAIRMPSPAAKQTRLKQILRLRVQRRPFS